MKTEIELTFVRSHFEEIYFKNNQGNYFRSAYIKSQFNALIIAIVASFCLLTYAWVNQTPAPLILVIFGLAIVGYDYFKAFRVLYRFNSQVKNFLNREEIHGHGKLTLFENHFVLTQSKRETIEKYINFSRAEINEDHMLLEAKETYLFPLKSMSAEDFLILKKIISEKFDVTS